MQTLTRVVIFVALFAMLCGTPPAAIGQAQSTSTGARPTGSIEGRVTSDGKAVANVAVMLSTESNWRAKTFARTVTDADGRYRLTGVPPGQHYVRLMAPTYVVGDVRGGQPATAVNLAADETVADIDFAVVRGGVITGRITDADRKPVIAERVLIQPADAPANGRSGGMGYQMGMDTDDRGVYRIYGLAPGRYRVSVGHSKEEGGMIRRGGGGGRGVYTRTFYPGTTDAEKARVVEVAAGGEATGIDITVGAVSKTFIARGRVVDAESGQPVADMSVSHGTMHQGGGQISALAFAARSNSRGEFQINDVAPGRYAVFIFRDDEGGSVYSEADVFEVSDADVSGLEMKVRRGVSLRGVAVIEGVSDRARAAQVLSKTQFFVDVQQPEGLRVPNWQRSGVNPDGSFQINGLRPGKAQIFLGGLSGPPPKGLAILRIERDGVEVAGGIDLTPDTPLTNLRVVLAYGSGIIRGQLKVENGTLPAGARIIVRAQLPNSHTPRSNEWAEVDARGRFVFEGLMAGDYELTLMLDFTRSPGEDPRRQPIKQTVTVTEGESIVTLVVNMAPTP